MAHYVDKQKFYAAMLEFNKMYLETKARNDLDKPRASEYIGKSLLDIGYGLSSLRQFVGYCLDEQTELLTSRGWIKYDQINEDEVVLCYDTQTNQSKWSKIKSVYREFYKGSMFSLTHKKLNALVTPGHKFLTIGNELVKVENLVAGDNLRVVPVAAQSPAKIIDDNLVRLVAWMVTEGYYKKGKHKHSVRIYQKKENGLRDIFAALNNLDIPFKIYVAADGCFNVSVCGEIVTAIIEEIAPNKHISYDFINRLTQQQRMLFIDTLIMGDGHITTPGRKTFYQKDEEFIDRFVYLCTLAGLYCSKLKTVQSTSFGDYEGWTCNVSDNPREKIAKFEHIDLNGGKRKCGGSVKNRNDIKNVPTVDYKGYVWCVETEYGNFVCRRNNKIYVTGNSFREDMVMDGVENCLTYIHDFDPLKGKNPFAYFTQIMYYAFLRRIAKENKQSYIRAKALEKTIIFDEVYENLTGDKLDYGNNYQIIENFEKAKQKKKEKRGKVKK